MSSDCRTRNYNRLIEVGLPPPHPKKTHRVFWVCTRVSEPWTEKTESPEVALSSGKIVSIGSEIRVAALKNKNITVHQLVERFLQRICQRCYLFHEVWLYLLHACMQTTLESFRLNVLTTEYKPQQHKEYKLLP